MTLTSFAFSHSGWFEADLISCTFANGAVIRATNHSVPLVGPDGFTYSPNLFGNWERGGITFERNALTSCDITVTAGTTVMFPGTTTPMLWVSKLFARASVTITTCTIDLTAPTTIVGSVVVFVGRCTAPSMTSTQATLHCADETYLLAEPWPRRVICAGCPFTLFDAQCGLNRNSFVISCAVGAGSTQTNLILGRPKNLLLWSEQFDNAAWLKVGSGSAAPIVTANNATDPNGNLTADSLAFPITTAGQFSDVRQAFAAGLVTASQTFAVSIWLSVPSGTGAISFNLQDGTFSQTSVNQTVSLTATPQRFTAAGTFTGAAAPGLNFVIRSAGVNPAVTVIAWGAQVEQAGAATTYAQTTVATTLSLGSVGNDSLPYSKGYIVPTTGQATGWPIMVTLQGDASHLNVQPFPLPLAVGDAFTLYPGCDGQKATCTFKFSNANFGGWPQIPGPAGALTATGS